MNKRHRLPWARKTDANLSPEEFGRKLAQEWFDAYWKILADYGVKRPADKTQKATK